MFHHFYIRLLCSDINTRKIVAGISVFRAIFIVLIENALVMFWNIVGYEVGR